MRKEIEEQALIYRKTANRPLSDFQVRVNDAAIELALGQPSLLRKGNRGELLERARRKVADDGYCPLRLRCIGVESATKCTRMKQWRKSCGFNVTNVCPGIMEIVLGLITVEFLRIISAFLVNRILL